MPSANRPDRDKIPDMSLGERSDKPFPQPVDMSSAYQPPGENAPPSSVPTARGDATPATDWQEGDRVLAPWEPIFLYSGTIKQIRIDEAKGNEALIEFDDGDDGWVFLFSLCPLEVKPGQKVLSRKRMGPTFFHGEVVDVNGEEVEVAFEDGSNEWTTCAALRIPCVENGPGAVPTKLGANRPPGEVEGGVGAGVPRWLIWVGLVILLAVVRMGCREVARN